jgi:acetyl-CoA C-acetyltransferase
MIAGGMESMSNVPYYIEKAKMGYKFGHQVMSDGLLKDGLWDVYYQQHMVSRDDHP